MTEHNAPADMFSQWRDWSTRNQDLWTHAMQDWLGSDTFSQAIGRALESYLSTQNTLMKATQDYTRQTLRTMNIPTAADMSQVSESVAGLEKKVESLTGEVQGRDFAAALQPVFTALEAQGRESVAALQPLRTALQVLNDRVDFLATRIESGLSQLERIQGQVGSLSSRPDTSVQQNTVDRLLEEVQALKSHLQSQSRSEIPGTLPAATPADTAASVTADAKQPDEAHEDIVATDGDETPPAVGPAARRRTRKSE